MHFGRKHTPKEAGGPEIIKLNFSHCKINYFVMTESSLKVFLESKKLSKTVVQCIYSASTVPDFEY